MNQQFTVYRFINCALDTELFRELYRIRACAFDNESKEAIQANLDLIENIMLVPAATITCTVEELFEKTNTINSAWYEAEGVQLINKHLNCRLSSSSMGDVFKDESGQLFMYTMSNIIPLR